MEYFKVILSFGVINVHNFDKFIKSFIFFHILQLLFKLVFIRELKKRRRLWYALIVNLS